MNHIPTQHTMQLQPTHFEKIKRGTKTIEIRLNDEKRKRICVGDTVVFTHAHTDEVLPTTVVRLHHFASFAELYDAFPAASYGGNGNDDPAAMYEYYSPEDEATFGVLGIEIVIS